MGLMSRLGQAFKRDKAAFGGWNLPVTGGHLPYETGRFWNWWQMGQDPIPNDSCPTVHACVDAYAQTLASLWGEHFEYNDSSQGKKILRNSQVARLLRNPNSYQTRSDFILNLIKGLLYHGNAYAVASRDDRGNIVALHIVPPTSTQPYVEPESKTVWYGLGDNVFAGEFEALAPSRDVMHVRLYCPNHPLVGVSPITNLATDIAANNSISRHQATFFHNMARPSGVLQTPEKLTAVQMSQLREAWNEQSQGLNSGNTPILQSGLEWKSMALTSQDAELISAFNMTNETIARAFRVPLPLIGDLRNATYNNVEQLISSWLSTGLGFLLEHIELSFDKFFELPDNQRVEFNAESLLRTDFAGRIEGITKGIQGGLYTPNEGRAKEGLPAVENGEKPYMQSQMVELGYRPEQPTDQPTEPVPEPINEETAKSIAILAIKKAMKK